MAEPRRLTLFDCIAIGVNGIIGSGIFLLPGWVALGAKSLSPLAFVACGALCTLVALCYAEVGGMFDRSGGTYLYAREALGDEVGFGVGWLVLVSCIAGYATIARGFGDQAAELLRLQPWTAALIAPALILLLGLANWRGVKTGARTSDVLTIVKVAALVLFVVGGILFILFFREVKPPSLGTPDLKGFEEGMVSALFALSGFEFVAVVAGQTANPRRTIPLAIVGSLIGAVVLYALIQLVVVGVLPQVAVPETSANAHPMVEAASVFGDGPAGLAVRIAALISMVGFCSGSALVGPQLFASLAGDGVVPRIVARIHPTRGTPNVAIGVVTVLAMVAAATASFKDLADLTIVTLFAQYVPTCLAVIIFRKWRPDAPRLFRVPLGATIPLAALVVMAALVTRIEGKSLKAAAVILALGIVVIGLTRVIDGKPPAAPQPDAPKPS